MTAAAPEGQIVIGFRHERGRFLGVAIENRRPRLPPDLFQGRPAADLAPLVSRLFSICRVAQGLCALEAVERALALVVPAPVRAARRMLVAAETLLEHGGRASIDYPQLLGLAPVVAGYKQLRRALSGLEMVLFPDGDWLKPGGGRLAFDRDAWADRLAEARQAVEEAVFGGSGTDLPQSGGWLDWARPDGTPAQRLGAYLFEAGLAGFGASGALPLPPKPLRGAAEGPCYLTGPLARLWDLPEILVLRTEHGIGLLAHLMARLFEMEAVLREMEGFVRVFRDGSSLQEEAGEGSDGSVGIATVEAARGRLMHQVTLGRDGTEGAVVENHRIDAPTEWNFAPGGPLERGLIDRPTGEDPSGRLRHLVVALDPCVAYRIEAR